MNPFDPDPSLRWLFCMTHPDDEISIAAWIRRLTQAGNEVFLSWSHSNPVREAEGRRAAAMLGIPDTNIRFFGAPDQGVLESVPDLLPRYRDWVDEVKPDRVACGAFEQGHLDHDATNLLVNRSFEGPVFEIPFYHAYLRSYMRINRFADPSGQAVLELTMEEQRFKKTIARAYRSQRIWWNLWWYEVWEAARFRPIELAKTERMRIQTHREWTIPNLPDGLREKVQACPKWKRWLDSLARMDAL